jgi:tRNA/tmRNA/rRNA uracil-C5-methylase (TrmA/RlmC/RlmD family)
MCDLVEVKEKPFSTRIKGRDIKGLDADIEARNNWKKAVADASNNVLKDKEDFIKLAEEKYNIPISGKPDRLSEENQKDIYNVVKSITEDIRPDILKDLTDIKFVKIRGNSAGQYHRDTKEIKINLNYYDKDESHKKSIRGNNQTHAEELKSTFAHELGHLVHRNNILINDSIAKFYQENKKAIEKYYKYVEKNIGLREHLSKSDSEFFAEAFSRYCTGKLAESKDIPAIKKETELIRNFMKEMITKLKEGEK